jgi:hypothetical protein
VRRMHDFCLGRGRLTADGVPDQDMADTPNTEPKVENRTDIENLAKAGFETLHQLQRSLAAIRWSVVAFGLGALNRSTHHFILKRKNGV